MWSSLRQLEHTRSRPVTYSNTTGQTQSSLGTFWIIRMYHSIYAATAANSEDGRRLNGLGGEGFIITRSGNELWNNMVLQSWCVGVLKGAGLVADHFYLATFPSTNNTACRNSPAYIPRLPTCWLWSSETKNSTVGTREITDLVNGGQDQSIH